MSARPPQLRPGEVVGSYRVVRQIGIGGMGAVYEMVHCHIARRAALKVLIFDGKDSGIATRFVNEARAANVISHPGIVQIFEYGQLPGGAPWLLMEFVEGVTLFARMQEWREGHAPHGLDPLSVLYQLATTLAVVHKKGIVHRDLKPSNIILTPDPSRPEGEQAKLLDFGIAKLLHRSLHELPDGQTSDPQTAFGVIMGTPTYMAPEQGRSAADVDAKADVYSLGVLAYELFTGHAPFVGEPLQIVARKLHEDAPPIAAKDMTSEFAALIMAMLRRDPTERPTMPEVAETIGRLGGRGLSGAELRALRTGTAHTALPQKSNFHWRRPAGIAAVLLVALGIGVAVWEFLHPAYAPDVVSIRRDKNPSAATTDMQNTAAADLRAKSADAATPEVYTELTVPPADMLEPSSESPDSPKAPVRPKRPIFPSSNAAKPRVATIPTKNCIVLYGPGANPARIDVFAEAARQSDLRLLPGQQLTLIRLPSGVLSCARTTSAPMNLACERFAAAADALWNSAWHLPTRVEVKCSAK